VIKIVTILYLKISVLVCAIGAQISSPFENCNEGVRAALETLVS